MGGGHDMHGGHGGGVKGFVSNLVGGGKGHGQDHGYGGHGQQHGYPPPAAGACPPYGGYPANGYAPAAYPAQPAPHHGGGHMGMGTYHTGHGGGHGHHVGGKHKGGMFGGGKHKGGMFGGGKHGRKWK